MLENLPVIGIVQLIVIIIILAVISSLVDSPAMTTVVRVGSALAFVYFLVTQVFGHTHEGVGMGRRLFLGAFAEEETSGGLHNMLHNVNDDMMM